MELQVSAETAFGNRDTAGSRMYWQKVISAGASLTEVIKKGNNHVVCTVCGR